MTHYAELYEQDRQKALRDKVLNIRREFSDTITAENVNTVEYILNNLPGFLAIASMLKK